MTNNGMTSMAEESDSCCSSSSCCAPKEPTVNGTKVGRNDPCPCGNGKKYKKCCGQ